MLLIWLSIFQGYDRNISVLLLSFLDHEINLCKDKILYIRYPHTQCMNANTRSFFPYTYIRIGSIKYTFFFSL